jgi:hypothetical protein
MANEQAGTNRCAVLAVRVLEGQDRSSLLAIVADTATEQGRMNFGLRLPQRLRELIGDQVATLSGRDIEDIVRRIRTGAELRLR